MQLIETDWLFEHTDQPNIKIIDGSWHMPNIDKNAKQDYLKTHIGNALFFDIDEIADIKSDLPHMLPDAEKFAQTMDKMGIGNDTHVIIYDRYGFFSAARVWWTFKIMGHNKVSILNGGLKKWRVENKPTTSDVLQPIATQGYKTTFEPNMVKSIVEIHKHISDNDIQIVDARPAARFCGKAEEPRKGLSSGHMPNGFNLPFSFLADENGCLKSRAAIKQLFEQAELDLTKPIVTTCGSGITAANLYFALDYIDCNNLALYDGSWAEYAANINSIIIKDIK